MGVGGGLSCDIYQFSIKSGQVNFELVLFDFVNLIQFLYLKWLPYISSL